MFKIGKNKSKESQSLILDNDEFSGIMDGDFFSLQLNRANRNMRRMYESNFICPF